MCGRGLRPDRRAAGRAAAPGGTSGAIQRRRSHALLQSLLATDDDLRRKPDPRLHLELGLLKLINAQRLAPLEEVLAELRGEIAAAVARRCPLRRRARARRTLRPVHFASSRDAVSECGAARLFVWRRRCAWRRLPRIRRRPLSACSTMSPATNATSAAAETAARSQRADRNRRSQLRHQRRRLAPRPVAARTRKMPTQRDCDAAQVEAIKAALQGQKFLWSMVEHATRWEMEERRVATFFPDRKPRARGNAASARPDGTFAHSAESSGRPAAARLC